MSVARRAFIQMSVGATVGILFTPTVWTALDDVSIWTQNWPWIPKLKYGEVKGMPTVSKMCESGCAVKVRTVAGEAFGVEGNLENPLSGGGVCPLCANGVQVKNSPTRIKAPMLNGEEITWEKAKEVVAEKLEAAGSKVAVISGDQNGTVNEVFSALLTDKGSDAFYVMPCDMQAADKAWNGLMGGSGQIGYDLEGADVVLLAGADALESWGPTVANLKAFAANESGKFLFAGPMQTKTAAVADKWVPVPAEGMAAFVLGITYYVLQAGNTVEVADFDQFKAMVMNDYSPAKVEAATGVKADQMAAIAKQLLTASNPVVVPGGSVAAHGAAFALNLLLGGAMKALPEFGKAVASSMSRSEMLKADILKGVDTELLFVYEANPAYALPEKVKAGFTVAFDTVHNETTATADLVLPTLHGYERFDDLVSPYGVGAATYALGAPVSKPSVNAGCAATFMLGLADLGFETFEDVLGAKVDAVGADMAGLIEGAAFVVDGETPVATSFAASVLGKAAVPVKGTGAVGLAPYTLLNIGTANQATTPNAPCTISNNQLVGDYMVVMMASATAKQLGVTVGSKVKLSGGKGECEALVQIFEGVLPGVVAAPLGLGHTVGDEFSKGKGDNVYKILTVSSEAAAGASTWAGSTVNVAKI
ncbi:MULTISPECIES: menaquinone reductase molybdopterin-binding-like subunit QrcB [unclassified Pseudodesulfovibrio]|uniref:menaquinone reductase molybdopterin-binding-like subunit QrcB n=1 Tax=unclassified Pseudodesulfovibrio TaxID=2661612 RepID=UPI000FEB9BBD|nr:MULTISPECIES: menaquinone reductase molybdopterin-binding-like subunit QrcB [unclassified Pseudodesulfovibrio]MCJ2163240.1 molybdopterin-dependent oxidoreductase [Pseudodesulfovibrio sp. S3-i]RWU07223.1 molybdopterin oxidoreductase [Pseudodesulfovibrio sp. S3]